MVLILSIVCVSVGTSAESPQPSQSSTHWAFGPFSKSKWPTPKHTDWISTPIDRFVLASLEKQGRSPEPRAEKLVEARRLHFDLTGLPPTPEFLQAYVSDESKDAFSRRVQSLLTTRAYGERMARMWLDVVRYADSDGYEKDSDRPNAWRYRDFVVNAFQSDMPFDQFVQWQIAGDEMAPDRRDAFVATGFLALGPFAETQPTDLEENREKVRYDNLDDVVTTVGSAFLGLTLGCARCHDHKFDPISMRDYYSMVEVFAGGQRGDFSESRAVREREIWKRHEQRDLRERKMAALEIPEPDRFLLRHPLNPNNPTLNAVYKKWNDRLKFTDTEWVEQLEPAKRVQWTRLNADCSSNEAEAPKSLGWIEDSAMFPEGWILLRGDPMRKGASLPPNAVSVLDPEKSFQRYWKASQTELERHHLASSGRRAALARWLTDVDRGAGRLVARVIVNRLWQMHFGEGLVKTPNDFGKQGAAPSQLVLLDALAESLVRSGWRLQSVQRWMLLSAYYRSASRGESSDEFHRSLTRLEAEAIRDGILSVSGVLNESVGGPAFKPVIPAEAMSTRSADAYPTRIDDSADVWRRSLYAFTKRSVRFPWAELFDAPDPTTSCGRRAVTTVPTQQLALLNDPFVRRRAIDFAHRLEREGQGIEDRIRRGYWLALGRAPQWDELAHARELIDRHSMIDFCHGLFLMNEFAYVE